MTQINNITIHYSTLLYNKNLYYQISEDESVSKYSRSNSANIVRLDNVIYCCIVKTIILSTKLIQLTSS